jgi:hypothetical protein
MSTSELKIDIIQKISNLSDFDLLNQISKLLQFKEEEDHLYGISEEERIGLEKAISDIKEGRIFNSNEANSTLKKWLNS